VSQRPLKSDKNMKKAITLFTLLAGALGAHAQGTLAFGDYGNNFTIDVFSPQLANPTTQQFGNSAFDNPAGSFVYTGVGLGGASGGAISPDNYANGALWTLALYAAPGVNNSAGLSAAESTGVPILTSLFQTSGGTGSTNTGTMGNDSAGVWAFNIDSDAKTVLSGFTGGATLQLKVWYNGGVTNPPNFGAQYAASPVFGSSIVGSIAALGGTGSPPSITPSFGASGITSFSLIGAQAPSSNITLTVIINGDGIVRPDPNGTLFKTNSIHTLTATAKSGNVFSNWTGSVTTNKNPFTFKLDSSMVLQANFIANPFLPVKGTYNGLFFTTNGVTEQTAGMLKGFIIGTKGTYSGALLINGTSHVFAGKFDLAGQATNNISRSAAQGGPLTLLMTINTNNPAPQVTGTVSGSNWTANLTANLTSNTLSSAEYTLLLPPDTNNAPPTNSPGGDGYALITNHTGTAKITGALADGTEFNQTVPVSLDGYVPIYANLYANKGLLLGWINLDSIDTNGVSLTWIHPSRPSGLYTNGFTSVLLTNQILLSPWTNPPANIGLLTNLSILETTGGSNTPILVTTTTAGKINGTAVSGAINLKTGLLTVTIGSGPAKTNGYGAVLLNVNNGGGYFLTKTNAQAITLGP
jgi:hypothetical protein